LIHNEDNSTSYFLGPVGISDPREFIEAESKRIPFKAALSGPQLWQDAFKIGEIGTRGYSQITVPKPTIGTPFASPNVWSYLWPRPPRMRAF
jgi:hypothetical protein